VTIVINPDAHATGGLEDLDYGIGVARRAGLGRADVFNTAPAEAIARSLQKRRGAGAR
jgi:DNA polymerase (family 10)